MLHAAETFCVVLVPEVDTAKPKDASEKKSKASKQQECIVCKKVMIQFNVRCVVEGHYVP